MSTDADLYFDGEVDLLRAEASQRKADLRAEQRAADKRREEAAVRARLRRKHTVSVESDDEGYVDVCLLDVDPDAMRDALVAMDAADAPLEVKGDAMRQARSLYLCGRKADAADAIYPAIRDALGVAV